ncbi:MAG: PQQ-like beta-propeller repeat protein [Planctomycetaceae bacterium]|nr:PQQ-like beta-propeller repeat protein [Planctomycetaceae bacterium]
MMRRWIISATAVLTAVAAGGTDAPFGWRGDGTGRFPQARPVIEWSPQKNVLWKTALPSWSNASPIIVGERIFLCAEPASLLCLNKADGKILWQQACTYESLFTAGKRPAGQPRKNPPCSEVTGYTSPTPVSDGKHVYVLFGSGIAACYDLQGNRLWARLVERPTHTYGHSTSPVLVGDKLLVHIIHMWALRASDGQMLWKTESAQAFGTPIVAGVGGRQVVITPLGDFIRVDDGVKIISKAGNLQYGCPVLHNDIVYFPQNNAWGVALPTTTQPQVTAPARKMLAGGRKERFYASSLIHENLLYMINQSGEFAILDLAGGPAVLDRKLDLGGGTTYPSITLGGRYIFISSDTGVTIVLEAGRQGRQVARNNLEPFRSSPIFEGSRMYIRALKSLYCVASTPKADDSK